MQPPSGFSFIYLPICLNNPRVNNAILSSYSTGNDTDVDAACILYRCLLTEKLGISATTFVSLKIEPYMHLGENIFCSFQHSLYSSVKMSLMEKKPLQSSSKLIEKHYNFLKNSLISFFGWG